VWGGRRSREYGKTWAQVEREAQRAYASQGWAGFPDVSTDPNAIGCDYMTQIDSRVPFTRGDLTAEAGDSSTMLEGAVLQAPGGLPLGTRLDLSTGSSTSSPEAAAGSGCRSPHPRTWPCRPHAPTWTYRPDGPHAPSCGWACVSRRDGDPELPGDRRR
jgi:hypothetical protein